MSQPQSPQAGIAGALTDLSEQTRILVRDEIAAAQRETWGKVRAIAPATGLLGGAGVLGLAASASAYRASLRILERWLPPTAAALVATAVYGAAAAGAGVVGARQLRTLPAPVPAETAQQAAAAVQETAAEVRRQGGDAASTAGTAATGTASAASSGVASPASGAVGTATGAVGTATDTVTGGAGIPSVPSTPGSTGTGGQPGPTTPDPERP
jgi:hypothetical protein